MRGLGIACRPSVRLSVTLVICNHISLAVQQTAQNNYDFENIDDDGLVEGLHSLIAF